jgi:hypothetical protein
MKHLKKCPFLISFLLLLTFVFFPAHAASNTDSILAALRSGITVNGQNVVLPATYANQAENYFASHKISDAQASYILAEINAAKEAIQEAGVTNLKNLDKSTKQKILSAAQAAANKIDLKLTVGSDKNVKIADSNGTIAFSDDNIIKTTGVSFDWKKSIPLFISFFAIIGFCAFAVLKFHLLRNEINE